MGHIPLAWGPSGLPPGAPIPSVPAGVAPAPFYQSWSDNGSYPLVNGACFGKWPAIGQSGYSNACYGHDEPAVNPFSDLPGSGGNVTWNVTLPVDRSPTQNQSDLYGAVWFGMNLYDPYGYSGQCFLELQLYPDTNGALLPQPGVWAGLAVAWQIELSTGFEDPCYFSLLTAGTTSAPFQMNQGDALTVRMNGWMGSPYGENISIVDQTTGLSSFLNLYNTTYHYPLDPAYLANNLDDSLPWSPGGDLPVAFSFESGHTINGPSNNSFGGCSSGVPPPTPLYPSTPCDSYDPQSWVNDTAQPWHIDPVQFFNSRTTVTATQLGFEQDFGGITWIDPLSLGSCIGRDGSAGCSYPWYSYARATNSLEFGATDYYGTTYDFGKYLQYDSTLTTNSAALGYFPVRNFTVPAPTGNALTIMITGIGAGGAVHFLNYTLTATTTINHVPSGSYSINTVPAAGGFFTGYTTSGGVAMDAPGTGWNSFRLTGTGTITASFSALSPALVMVHVNSPGNHGSVGVSPGFNLRTVATYPGQIVAQYKPIAWTSYTSGNNLNVVPGIYSIQALPSVGYNFTGWSFTGGIYVFAPQTNYTWINITSTGGGTLTANFAPTPMTDTVWLVSVPATGGTITFNGTTYPSGSVVSVRDGTFTATATPNAGFGFATWSYLWSASLSQFASTTSVVLQNGTAWIYALFNSTPVVTPATTGTAGGRIAINGVLASGPVPLPQVEAGTYPIVAAPGLTSSFSGWTVSDPTRLWVLNSTAALSQLVVNGSGTLTAHFSTPTAGGAVTFDVNGMGYIEWNVNQAYPGGFTNDSVGAGTYSIVPVPGTSTAEFGGWSTSGGVRIVTLYTLNALGEWVVSYGLVVGGSGTVNATFVGRTVPVTFVDDPSATGTVATFSGTGPAVAVAAGTTANLAPGSYTVTLSGGTIPSVRWTGTSNLTVGAGTALSVPVTVAGAGTLYALAFSHPVLTGVLAAPTIVEPSVAFTVTATLSGGTAPFLFNFSLGRSLAGGCTPGVFSSADRTNSSECQITVTLPGTYSEVVYANVTDRYGFTANGSATVQLFWPPTLTFSEPAAGSQLSSTTNLSLPVSWANTVPPAALPGLEETVGLIDQATGAYITNTPTTTNPGLASLWVPAAATNSVTLGPGDLFGGARVAPGNYWVAVSFWSTANLSGAGYPTHLLMTVEESITAADVQLLTPAVGSTPSAGSVAFAYVLDGPGITVAQLTVTNQSGPVFTAPLPLQPSTGTGTLVHALAPGSYTATLSTFNRAANSWLNSSSTFTVSSASSGPPGSRTPTSVPSYVYYVYAGLVVLGAVAGLLVMWVVTRRRQQPPAQLRPLTPAGVPPAVAPGVPHGIPPGPSDWDEGPPSRR